MHNTNCGYFEIRNGGSKCYLYDQNASCTAVGAGKDTFGVYSGQHPRPAPPSPAPHPPHPGPSPAPPGPPGPTDADSIVIAISDPRDGYIGGKHPGVSPALVLSGVTVQEAVVNQFHTHNAPAYCSMNVTAKGALVGNFENKCGKAGGMCFGMRSSSRASESLVAWCL